MKPIKAKISPDQILALQKIFDQLEAFKPTSVEQKVTHSVLFEITEKIHGKYRSIIKSSDLFNENKPVTITFKYHEAYAVVTFIQMYLPRIPKAEKAHNDLLKLSNFLHQKLS